MTLEQLRELVAAECSRLNKLGSTEAIAQELHSRGMRGQIESACFCPLARGICDTLMMSPGRLHVGMCGVSIATKLGFDGLLAFPPLLHAFVEQFDRGDFPYLIKEAAHEPV